MIHATDVFGLVKTSIDVHTLGMVTCQSILKSCGFSVVLADVVIERVIEKIERDENREIFTEWIKRNHIDHISFSYRLDPTTGFSIFSEFYMTLRKAQLLKEQGGPIKIISFAGLSETCMLIRERFGDRIKYFKGEESPLELICELGIPETLFPSGLRVESIYDKKRDEFATSILTSDEYLVTPHPSALNYQGYGTFRDTMLNRIISRKKVDNLPILRTHIGPYLDNRFEALKLYKEWVRTIAKSGYLDVLSIGTSQLSQSMFEENWNTNLNGGGVPINSREEFFEIAQLASPMLVRSYAGTNNLLKMAKIHEQYLNIAWHAFSFWWFNILDGRGPLKLEENLIHTFQALQYAAETGKPVEANVSHHFAFRGSDDLTYIITNYLTAVACKNAGIKTYIVQNMLNTPRFTWGVQDIAKSRAMMSITRKLEDRNFKVIFETRAGLSLFSSDIDKAKKQLVATTLLMDDLAKAPKFNPDIIHVVNYSEGKFLADPDVVIESIKLTLHSLKSYQTFKKKEGSLVSRDEKEWIENKEFELVSEANSVITAMEQSIPNLYSPEGFNIAFKQGWFPVPHLWVGRDEYSNAVNWDVQYINGGYYLVNELGKPLSAVERTNKIRYGGTV
ncbi:hypothetical protein SAMN06298221_12016 [Sphaerochaeta associata]|uniref:Cobalamin-binding protein n=1 Tax=Sphaerochaeta associata TaxID=1129264 RepID=A0ABY4DB02_9SPIR|nr:hypothetical protein [Sphaerochaeta associata]UOM51452.1 hypothetical protein MUG09_01525 [Sphaerochaeta associata]SMP65571.1 hypothetical protein SAMN06298221_12016 [Sphaerochaeta associata]